MAGKFRRWADLKTTDFGSATESSLALLPVAATEQHGPHLPLGTDAFILRGVLARTRTRIGDDTDVLLLPLQHVGDSLEHADFPGTLTQDAETLIEAWTAIGEAVADTGLRRLAIVNAHGGQPQIVDIVAKRLRAERGLLVGRINTFLFGAPDGLFTANELAFGFHGGEIETSMMLAIAPHLVDMDAARDFPNRGALMARKNAMLRAEGAAAFAWQAQDLNREGATGHAAKADAERGSVMLDHLAGRLAQALDELAAFPLDELREEPK